MSMSAIQVQNFVMILLDVLTQLDHTGVSVNQVMCLLLMVSHVLVRL